MTKMVVKEMDEKECAIAIYLYGDDIQLDAASELLGLSATRSGRRGDSRSALSGAQSFRKIGFWEYREHTETREIDSSLSRILLAIKATDTVVGCAGITRADLDIFKPLDPKDDPLGFSFDLSPGLLLRIAQLGFNLIVTAR
jgi:hypothetical protein